jgi:hypothetical protein
MTQHAEPTRFLNVDLELIDSSDVDLDPLLEHLANATFTLRDSVEEGKRTVWLELNHGPEDVDDAITRFADLVESLPSDIRMRWNQCHDRCLNIGIQGGSAPHASAFRIATKSLAKAAAISTRMEITVYAPPTPM